MPDRVFLDSNVLVYLYDVDVPEKQGVSRSLLAKAVEQRDLEYVISTQVLQEYYVTVTRKFARTMSEQEVLLAMNGLRTFPTVQVDVPMIFEAIELGRRFKFSFWDSLIVKAATSAGCSRVLSEDLQHQMRIGDLVIENPFLQAVES
jgi:predicted nucleic acid-binding protein